MVLIGQCPALFGRVFHRDLIRIPHGRRQFSRTARLQGIYGTQPIADVLVLAEFALADQRRDLDFYAYDVLQHFIDECGLGVAHFPGLRFGRFVCLGQTRHNAAHEAFVVVNGEDAMSVYDLVVPGGNLAVRLVLAGVPVRRDVALGASKDDQDFGSRRTALPDRIGARDVGGQPPVRAGCRVELERNVIGIQSVVSMRDQDAQRMLANDTVQGFRGVFGKVSGNIHRVREIMRRVGDASILRKTGTIRRSSFR